MDSQKRRNLEKHGWKVGDTRDFLDLSDAEYSLIEIKRALMQLVRQVRESSGVTQVSLAENLCSSQSRVSKLEACSDDVSLDLIVRALLILGVSKKDIGKTIVSV